MSKKLGISQNVVVLCLLSLLVSSFGFSPTFAATKTSIILKDGSSCPKLKQVIVKNNYKYTCVKKKSKLVWQSVPIYSAPDFQDSDVTAEVVADAPIGDIQYEISWSGLDVNGLQFPDDTQADILIDGAPSGYQVDNTQSVSFYISNESHEVSLSVSGVENVDLVSGEISEDALDIPVVTPITIKNPGPPQIPASANPNLNCTGSGETAGQFPGWINPEAAKVTVISLKTSGSYAVFWCPASNPNGKGIISYAVTASPGGNSCVTVQTNCEIDSIQGSATFYLMAADENGSYKSNEPIVPNSGETQVCSNFQNYCQSSLAGKVYPFYGNSGPGSIGDCTFAAVANWEHVVLGKNPDPAIIGYEFSAAGGTDAAGLSHDRVFSYWKTHGIAGVYLQSIQPYFTDPVDLMNALDNPEIGVVIAELEFTEGNNFAGTYPTTGGHWVLVVGYTPTGPLVVTWGQTLQMTWQQWNHQTTYMWGITAK